MGNRITKLIGLSAAIVVCSALMLLCLRLTGVAAAYAQEAEDTTLPASALWADVPEPTPRPTPVPSEPEPEYTPTVTPDPYETSGIMGVQEREYAPAGFFRDAVFVGNSLIEGLGAHGELDEATFLGTTGASLYNFTAVRNFQSPVTWEYMTLYEALTQQQWGKIYILLGINEITADLEPFIADYAYLVDSIAAVEPYAEIYIMGISPVTELKSTTSKVFTMPRIQEYNAALYQMTKDHGWHFIDDCAALADETGFLPAYTSWDGVHLYDEYYPGWAYYIRTHYCG